MADSMDSQYDEIDLQKLLKQQLLSLAQFGVRELPTGSGEFEFQLAAEEAHAEPVVQEPIAPAKNPPKPASKPVPAAKLPTSDKWGPATVHEDRPAALDVISAEVSGCTRCEELCTKRTQTVFGVGSPSTRLVFVGEGPGADEDRLGEPFVGAAGKLLNKILAASKLKREEVYILNTVKCRPPRNRNPTETEIRDCWGYAQRQLEVIQPEFICCLGSVAAKTMLQTTQSLGRLRGKFHAWKGARLIVTYHPAYLLRNEGAKRHVWEDMQMLVKEMGIDLSK